MLTMTKTEPPPQRRPAPSSVACAAAASDAPPSVAERALPWAAFPGGVVDGGEIVILAIKPSMWRPVLESAAWLVTSWLLAAVLTWFGRPIPGLSITATAQLVLLVGLARLAVAIVRWIPTWYVLTNRRIIDIQGARTPKATSCALIDIRNTYQRPTPVERQLALGTILFVSNRDGRQPRPWRSIAKPDEVHARIRRAIEHAIDQHGAA